MAALFPFHSILLWATYHADAYRDLFDPEQSPAMIGLRDESGEARLSHGRRAPIGAAGDKGRRNGGSARASFK
jgi:hypothetical protein